MPIIDTPAGTLEVTNAILSASEFRATQKISVSNSAPTKNFSVGDKFHVSTTDADAVNITGNLVAQTLKIGNLLVSPTFDLAAVSNVGNTTSNTLQFANATTSFVASSNVEIGGNITLTSNAQVKVGSNVLAEYTGPHGREPKEMPLKKFPEIAFDASKFDKNDTTNTYTQGGYTISTNAQYFDGNYAPWEMYVPGTGPLTGTHYWSNDSTQLYNAYWGGTLVGSPSAHYQTVVSSVTYNGVFTTIQLPHKIKLNSIDIQSHKDVHFPHSGIIAGSTDGSTWNLIHSFSELSTPDTPVIENIITNSAGNTNHYNYLRLIITKGGGTAYIGIRHLRWNGTEEPAPPGDLSLDTTLKSTFNSVRSNNYVMYFDGEDPAAGNVPKYLPSGSVKSITPNNVVFDATNNCWTLDGSTESNVTTGSLGFEGDVPHTVSTWINASNLEANALTQQLFSIGSGYDKAFLKVDDTQIAANTWHNVTYAYQGEGGSKVTYVDGRKVEEAQVEDTFGDYPPFAMTGYKTGGYCVSASSTAYTGADFNSWYLYDDRPSGNNGWHSESNFNSSDNYAYNGDANLGGQAGEWNKLEMPHKLVLNYFKIRNRGSVSDANQSPEDFKIIGSNDDVNWTDLFSVTGVTWSGPGVEKTYSITSNSIGYKYLAFLCTRTVANSALTLNNISYYGHKEGDLTRFPEPTRVLKYPHLAMTGPGQRGYVASASSSSGSLYRPWRAFNDIATSNDVWTTLGTPYNTSNGSYAGGTTYQTTVTDHTPTAVNGEFLQIELPNKIKPTKFRLSSYPATTNSYRQPRDGVFAGSNNGTDWVLLKSYTNQTSWSSGVYVEITPDTNTTTAYKYLRLIITNVNTNSDGACSIHSWQILGTEEDTGTPAIVGGPFAGKVANFRVYDQYLGDERIQEIYDAQKDEFGHKKSSMTFYKGRVGVGTTEPEGALTVIDEPHALEKFPARAISADDSYVEGDGQIKLSVADGTGYQAFDGLTSTSWTATPTRNTRLSEEVDFGAWLKIQTPESMSLKKAEIEPNPYWNQVGATFQGVGVGHQLGDTVACNKDGTRIAIAEPATGGTITAAQDGRVRIYDWNGSAWTQVGQNLTGTQSDYYGAGNMGFSDDGHRFITSSPNDGTSGGATPNAGVVEVYYLSGATWTILGTPFTSSDGGAQVGKSCAISGDGNTIAFVEYQYDDNNVGVNAGRTRVFTWNGTTWVQKGSDMIGDVSGDGMGRVMEMTSDGNYVIIGNYSAGSNNGKVWIYAWNGSAWVKRGNTLVGTGADLLGFDVTISDDANTIAIGENHNDDKGTEAGAVEIRTWNGSAYVLTQTLYDAEETTGRFGSAVALSGDGTRLVAVTHHSPDGSGSAHGRARVFEYYGGSWQLRQPFTSIGAQGNAGTDGSGSALGQEDGLAVSRDGSVIVVGLKNDDTSGNANSGQAKVFNMPSNIKSIWGSNDDVNWTKITTGNETFRGNDRLEFKNLDNPNYYKYHAIVADAFTQLKDVKLFGVRNQGSSTLHDGALTLTKNLDVPRIGPPLDADDTPRRDRLVVEYNTSTNPMEDGLVQDTSGRGNDGVFYGGASYDATEKALVFDGTTSDQYVHTLKNGTSESGNIDYSVSLWFNPTTVNVARWRAIFAIGVLDRTQPTDNNGDEITLFVNNGTNALHLQNGGSSVNTGALNAGQWVHIVVTYDGTNRKIYLDGSLSVSNGYSSINLPKEMLIRLAQSIPNGNAEQDEYMDCKISNFKTWFGAALTAQEVKTLYDMGRCDEGGHVVNFSKTRVGIGLGDEEVPQAALDVRGVANFGSRVGVGTTVSRSAGGVVEPFQPLSELDIYNPVSTELIVCSHAGSSNNPSLRLWNFDDNNYNNHGAGSSVGTINFSGNERVTGDTHTENTREFSYANTLYDWARISAIYVGSSSTSTSQGYVRGDLAFYTNNGDGAASDLQERMRIKHDGNVGIGTSSPQSPFHVNPINGTADSENAFLDFRREFSPHGHLGIFATETHANAVGPDLRFKGSIYNGTSNPTITQVMCLKPGGNVGIGTAVPYAKLHVHGTGNINSATGQRSLFYWGTNFQRDTSGFNHVSIFTTGPISTNSWIVSLQGAVNGSDERIKKDITDVDDGSALETLRLLKPKKYKYVDEIQRGSEPVWGFIAQEVGDTLPYATQLRTECLPNIYELANVSASNVITFTNFDTSNLESNAMVLKVSDKDDMEHLVNITEVVDDHSVRVEEDLSEWTGSVDESGNVVTGNQLFVYGQQVDDFVFLKKDAIWTVATSALQEVDRQLQAEKAKVTTLETQLTSVLARLDALESA